MATGHGAPLSVLQLPQPDDFAAPLQRQLATHGVTVVELPATSDALELPVRHQVDVVHVRHPVLLARRYGPARTLMFLRGLVASGAVVVQSIHTPQPAGHHSRMRQFVAELDEVTVGTHVFSAEHERYVRPRRPRLTTTTLRLPPPYTTERPAAPGPGMTLGCFGPVRHDGRMVRFAHAFHRAAGPEHRLVLAGGVESSRDSVRLAEIAEGDERVTFVPGAFDRRELVSLMRTVGWVVLPFRRIYASEVLTTALDIGRPIVASHLVGFREYGVRASTALLIRPWDDRTALRRWARLSAAWELPAAPPAQTRPTWSQAAAAFARFYRSVAAGRLNASAAR